MAPPFVAHIFAWMQSGVFIVTEIMYAPRFWRLKSKCTFRCDEFDLLPSIWVINEIDSD